MVDLIIVCSSTNPDIYEVGLKKSLEIIGMPYLLILTDPTIDNTPSTNSIIQTNLEDIKQSKYLLLIAQDILIKDENWGRKLVESCDSLPDFGCGGVECRDCNGHKVGYQRVNGIRMGNTGDPPVDLGLACCDGGFIIIPSYLFLEKQLDPQFPWYPVLEDYAMWIKLVKRLKIYHVPVKEYYNEERFQKTRWVSQFKNGAEFCESMRVDHKRLLKKWNLNKLPTTSFDHGED